MALYGPKQLIESFRTVRKNTIVIAEDIPETDYEYRPTPESRSVAETLVHIALLSQADRLSHGDHRVASLEGFNLGELLKRSEMEEKRPRSKNEIIDLLRMGGERWCEWVTTFPEAILAEQVPMAGGASKNRFELLIGTKEHEMHCRVAYLRRRITHFQAPFRTRELRRHHNDARNLTIWTVCGENSGEHNYSN